MFSRLLVTEVYHSVSTVEEHRQTELLGVQEVKDVAMLATVANKPLAVSTNELAYIGIVHHYLNTVEFTDVVPTEPLFQSFSLVRATLVQLVRLVVYAHLHIGVLCLTEVERRQLRQLGAGTAVILAVAVERFIVLNSATIKDEVVLVDVFNHTTHLGNVVIVAIERQLQLCDVVESHPIELADIHQVADMVNRLAVVLTQIDTIESRVLEREERLPLVFRAVVECECAEEVVTFYITHIECRSHHLFILFDECQSKVILIKYPNTVVSSSGVVLL